MYASGLYEICLSLYRQKMRVFFSALALCVATCTLCCLGCFYNHASYQMHATMQKIQNHALIHISQFNAQPGSAHKFTLANIKQRLGHLLEQYVWSAYYTQYDKIVLSSKNISVHHIYTDKSFVSSLGLKLQHGRYFTSDDNYDSYYCLIGHGLYQKLLQQGIHQDTVTLGSKRYRIIGVLKDDKNTHFHIDINNSLISIMSPSQYSDHEMTHLSIHVPNQALYTAMPKHITNSVIGTFVDYNFYVFNPITTIQQLYAQLANLKYLVAGIALSCFVVVSSSVINSLLASIVERRKEIGIRIALGASRAHIRTMLLCEMSLLTIVSSLIGVFAAMLILQLYSYRVGVYYTVSSLTYVVSFLVTYLIAIIATLYPTYKAQNFGPIQLMQDRL